MNKTGPRGGLLYSGVTLLAFATTKAAAQSTYPPRPIRFLVPVAAGSSQDILTRILTNKLSQQMNQQFVVDARAGAGAKNFLDF